MTWLSIGIEINNNLIAKKEYKCFRLLLAFDYDRGVIILMGFFIAVLLDRIP